MSGMLRSLEPSEGEPHDAALRQHVQRAVAAGAEIHEYQPTMFHCKVLVVDGLFVSVGSTNFDTRSFRLNDEANLNVLDPAFAARQVAVFEQDLKHTRRVTHEQWLARPWHEKLLEEAAEILEVQL